MRHWIVAMAGLMALAGVAAPGPLYLSNEEITQELKRVLARDLPKEITLSIGRLSVNGQVKREDTLTRYQPKPPFGMIQFQFESLEPQRGPIYGNAAVKAFAPILVAKQSLSKGDTLSKINTQFETRELTPLMQTGFYTQSADAGRLVAKTFIRAGVPIGTNNTQAPFAVASGQLIDLVHRQGPLEITARVKAIENGHVGDWIRVENPQSRKLLRARVVRQGEVESR